MKKVTRYQAIDGQLFDTEEQCLLHEKARSIEDYISNHDDLCWRGCEFSPETIIKVLLERYTITPKG